MKEFSYDPVFKSTPSEVIADYMRTQKCNSHLYPAESIRYMMTTFSTLHRDWSVKVDKCRVHYSGKVLEKLDSAIANSDDWYDEFPDVSTFFEKVFRGIFEVNVAFDGNMFVNMRLIQEDIGESFLGSYRSA